MRPLIARQVRFMSVIGNVRGVIALAAAGLVGLGHHDRYQAAR